MSIKDRSTLDNRPPLKGFWLVQELPQGTCLELAAAFTELHNCLLYRHGGVNSSYYETYDHCHLNIFIYFLRIMHNMARMTLNIKIRTQIIFSSSALMDFMVRYSDFIVH